VERDVVPADVVVAVEFDQGPTAHINGLDQARLAVKAAQFGAADVGHDVFIGVFVLQFVDRVEVERRHRKISPRRGYRGSDWLSRPGPGKTRESQHSGQTRA